MRLTSYLSALVTLLTTSTTLADHPSSAIAPQDYNESLFLKTLPGDSVLASFRFITNGTFTHHHSLFPRSVSQILEHSGTRELHLKFTLGRWDSERWGAQIRDGKTAGGTGVEIWAWVEGPSSELADARWTRLNNALSGLFCASLNFIDGTRTIRPVMSFTPPDGHHKDLDRLHLMHGSLPREPVCTENLTPFLKLLPCKGKTGISSLLDGHKLFDAQWQSMSIDVLPVCEPNGEDCKLQIIQTVDMVLDVERSLQRRNSPVPKPQPLDQLSCDPNKWYGADGDACFPRSNIADHAWSLSEIFGRPLSGQCPLTGTAREQVCADVPAARPIFISAGAKEVKRGDSGLRCFILPEEAGATFDLIVPDHSPPPADVEPPKPPPLYASRSLTGHGQEHGGVQAVLRNPSPTKAVDFVYLESLPWFMKPYLHTLRTSLIPPPLSNNASISPITSLYYLPPLDRARGTHLEASLTIPPNSTLILTYDFSKSILRYTEYPPDANRGFDIPGAMITIADGSGFTIRTTSLLLSLPTPDFSMPYNVIILTSTVIALAFGSIYNILVRRFAGADEVEGRRKKIERVKSSIKGLLARIGGKEKAE